MAKGKRKAAAGDVATNRQASFRFDLLERFEAGLVLTGTEVKSLREGKAQLKDGYATLEEGEVWLHNVHIPPYGNASRDNHDPERPRKLLLHRREIDKLTGAIRREGMTLVPLSIYFNHRGQAKIALGLAKGRRKADQRAAIKDRDWQRQKSRLLRTSR